jgi:hypothetical protein
MLWGASTVKAILGGLAGEDLREISELAREYREITDAATAQDLDQAATRLAQAEAAADDFGQR